ncbi:LysR substrate-binding domain-containing protein [Novosphingobium sp. 2580]|uniref:LysR substrate-binding domain-containing protein n=1 Tax=Novosphingobium album (ex Hu et al. 2023) TaxID=2930093 RepID=A0ABT0B3C1_9SPHN|nr:LysR substrate-binding domain-containing protein [Novosphingobium album (ex Hu et al. 2023)]
MGGRQAWGIDDVLTERWVVREKGSDTGQTLATAMRLYLSRWRIGMEHQQIEAILEMVAVSSLIGCFSRVAAQPLISRRRLVEIKVPELELQRRFYVMTHKAKYFTAGIRAFLDICEGV